MNTEISLHIVDWNNSRATSGSIGLGSMLGGNATALQDKIRADLGNDYGKFKFDFVNYADTSILCVNTDKFLRSIPVGRVGALKFTLVRMPAEFNEGKEKISSFYEYGERLSVVVGRERTLNSRTETIVYRDANVKGRSKKFGSTTTGGGIGVWS